MKKIILPAVLFAGWMALLNTDIPAKGSVLPALGRFLSPFTGVWQNVKPQPSGTMLPASVKDKVLILLDDRAVPHVYAAHTTDAIYAQGYLHAANRLFAMDLTTRSAAGRLSEMLGSRTLEYDRNQRQRGYEFYAIQKAAFWETIPENKVLLDAYTQGVNDYVRSLQYKDWPFEYKLLSYTPCEWTSLHTALVATSMAISLCLGEHDQEYSHALSKLDPEDFTFLYPEHNVLESPVIAEKANWLFNPVNVPTPSALPNHSIGFHLIAEEEYLKGSNNWAVGPLKTANGVPILANDPHLNLTLPNIWYEMEMHTPEMHVHGATLPGLPFVIIGFNDKIAWGSTNSGQDVLDWYRITWHDSTRHQYRLDGQLTEAELRPESIKARNHPTVTDTIRYTRFGPVSHLGEHKDMAMKWIGHVKAAANDVDYLIRINKAKNLQDYREAVASFQYPAQNKIFASIEGDIAISVAGVMPLRPTSLGESIIAGDASQNDWQGFIPFAHAPFSINPERGYVSSGNQMPAGKDYPYPMYGRRYFEDYRGRHINILLDTAENITIERMRTMQQNNYSLFASEMLPVMISLLEKSECSAQNKYLDDLRGWNFRYDAESTSAILFELWYDAFEKRTWEELDSADLMRPEDWRFIEIARDYPDHLYFDVKATPDTIENAANIACKSFMEMINLFLALPEAEKGSWTVYKKSVIPHLARLPGFGESDFKATGAKHIINAMDKSNGPSWRMVVELTDPPHAWINYPGGQSGDVASPHFKDFLHSFFEGKYFEVQLRPDPDNWNPDHQIQLNPRP
jgi:penicillin amidase